MQRIQRKKKGQKAGRKTGMRTGRVKAIVAALMAAILLCVAGLPARNVHAASAVAVDGNYQDWMGYPVTGIGYGGTNGTAVHTGQITTDGERLYAHFKMADNYGSRMQFQNWNLQINGQTYMIQILPTNADGSVNWSGFPEQTGTYTHFLVAANYAQTNNLAGQVAFTIHDDGHSQGDDIEFSIDMKSLAAAYGLNQSEMGTISISNPNLGPQAASVAGTSSGPVAGVILGMLIAGGAAMAFSRKGKKGIVTA